MSYEAGILDIGGIEEAAGILAGKEKHAVLLSAVFTNDMPYYGGEAAPQPLVRIGSKTVPVVLRPTSIMGAWRWWARVVVMDVLGIRNHREAEQKLLSIDAGKCSRPLFGVVKNEYYGYSSASRMELIVNETRARDNPLYLSLEEIRDDLRRVLRIGAYRCTGRGDGYIRRIAKSIRDAFNRGWFRSGLRVLGSIPRLQLLYQGLREYLAESLSQRCKEGKSILSPDEVIDIVAWFFYTRQPLKPYSLEISLELIDRCLGGSREARSFAASTLLLSMVLGGIGGLTSRGFGKLLPKSIHLVSVEDDKLEEAVELLSPERVRGNTRNLYGGVTRLLETARSRAAELLGGSAKGTGVIRIEFKRSVKEPVTGRGVPHNMLPELHVLSYVGKATLKSTWKRLVGKHIRDSGVSLHTWILGLPRSIRRGRDVTGYMILSDAYIVDKNTCSTEGYKQLNPRRRSLIEFRPVIGGRDASLIVYSVKSYGIDSDGRKLDLLRHICETHELVHIGDHGVRSVCCVLESKNVPPDPGGAEYPDKHRKIYSGIHGNEISVLDDIVDRTFDAIMRIL